MKRISLMCSQMTTSHYQSEQHCAKTLSAYIPEGFSLITSQNDTAPKPLRANSLCMGRPPDWHFALTHDKVLVNDGFSLVIKYNGIMVPLHK